MFMLGGSPATMHPSVFKVPIDHVYPMGKHVLIVKGGSCSSTVLAAVS